MTKTFLAASIAGLSLGFATTNADAQIVIGGPAPIILNFNNLNSDFGGAFNATGGASAFPVNATPTAPVTIYSGSPNPALVSSSNDFNPGGVYSNTDTYSNSNSVRALRDGATSDLALGLKDSTDRTFTLRLQNGTGSTIAGLSVGYAVEQYSIADSATQILFSYSLDGTVFVTTNLSGAEVVAASTNGTAADVNLATVSSTSRSGVITESLAPNAEIYLRFTYDHQSGTSVHLGVDDVAVAVVPEPTTAITLLSGLGMLGLLRRRNTRA